MSSLAFLLLLCLSCHAGTARPVKSTQNEAGEYQYDKDFLDKVEENQSGQLQNVTNNYKTNICERFGKASTLNGGIVDTSGTEVITSSYQTDLPSTFKTKGMRKHGRWMLGPAKPQHRDEEAVDPNASDDAVDVEDEIVDMDYAQPHRKPPIHNEKP